MSSGVARDSQREMTTPAVRSRFVQHFDSAEAMYQVVVEEMNEGAATVSPSGVILYVNRRLAEILKAPMESIVGASFERFLSEADAARLRKLLRKNDATRCVDKVFVLAQDGTAVPLRLSITRIASLGTPVVCVIATDVSAVERRERELRATSDELAERVS